MKYKKLSLFFYFLFLGEILLGQPYYKDILFALPIDSPILLSGNFGEIRSTHFHSGIDIKTQGVIGKKIYAIEEGYISRIKVQANGYGKSIYINHPNGYTSVYGHLNGFTKNVENLIKEVQYKNKEFEINFFPKTNEFKVYKGQVIGFSGNTGSSKGPHLHFEIRETKGQIPVNPLLFNFNIKDNIPPILYSLSFYPLNENSFINNKNESLNFKLEKNKVGYFLKDTTPIYLTGDFGFGIEMNDFLNNSRNKCGVYELSLFINDSLFYKYIINKFSFYESGYVKSHIDYSEKNKSKRTIQKTFIAPNNNLSIYKSRKDNGHFTFSKDTNYNIRLVSKDVYGNCSNLFFTVMGRSSLIPDSSLKLKRNYILMDWSSENFYEDNEIKLRIPRKALYDSLHFKYSLTKVPQISPYYSNVHHVHNVYTPLHKKYSLSLKLLETPKDLKNKLFIAQLNEDKINPIGGEVVNGFITSETKNFGDFVVLADTVAPEIELINNKSKLINNKIQFLIKDELSGIKTYNGYIDNKWALFEYDLKNDLLFYVMDGNRIEKNKEHELELFIVDNNDNVATFYTKFTW